ncbi:MAG: T9SS type A sorting domain-containing protein [Chitinophagales bacterium]
MKTNTTHAVLIFLFLSFLFLHSFNVEAQSITFQKAYGTTDTTSDAFASCVRQTNDGGYISTGYISNFGAGDDDYYLLKADALGNIQWTKTYGDTAADDANSVIQTSGGGYAMIGTTVQNGGEEILFILTDASGNVSVSKIYGDDNTIPDASASSIKETNDGAFIVAGYMNADYGIGADDVFLMKIEADGNMIWGHIYGGVNDDDATDVEQTNDHGYIITGITKSFNDVSGDVYLIKTDSDGNLIWGNDYSDPGGGHFDMGTSVQQTTDSGYVIAGVTQFSLTGQHAFLIKTDGNGALQWSKAYGTNDASSDATASSVQQTTDGGYIFTGYISNFGAGGDDYFLVKTNASGDTLWTKAYGSSEDDDPNFVRQTNDLGYIIGGVTLGFELGGEHLYLVKTDASGNTPCAEYNTGTAIDPDITFDQHETNTIESSVGIQSNFTPVVSTGGVAINLCGNIGIHELSNSSADVNVHPDPFSDQATVTISPSSLNLQQDVFVMYDVMGKEVRRINLTQQNTFTIERDGLPSSIYFYNVVNGNKILFSGKLSITD